MFEDTISDDQYDNDTENEGLPKQQNDEESDIEEIYIDQNMYIEMAENDNSRDDDDDNDGDGSATVGPDEDVFRGKDGRIWTRGQPIAQQTERYNILRQNPGQ